MRYENIVRGRFILRENRFIARVDIDGKTEVCHVKNTGRCKELLVKDAEVFLEPSKDPNRKTKYSLVAVNKKGRLINMDSQAPNKAVEEALKAGKIFENVTFLKRECKYKDSRFDFYIEQGDIRTFIEVKGVTLENNNIVSFPDAPSERAVKHVNELAEAVKEGFKACILFVVQMKDIEYFTPNEKNHKEFALALKNAYKNGVDIIAYDCSVSECEMILRDRIRVVL